MSPCARRATTSPLFSILLTGVALSGCGDDASPGSEDADDADDIRTIRAAADLTDADIESLISLVNGSEIVAAKAVLPKLVSPAARQYAQMLVDDHTAVRAVMPAEEDASGLPPATFATMRAITHAQAGMFATLPAGPGFDVFFIATQEGTHAMVLDSLHHWHALAEDAELRNAIAFAIQGVEKHLQRARVLQRELSGLSAPAPADTIGPVMPYPGPPDTLTPQGMPPATSGRDTLPPDTAGPGAGDISWP